MDHALAEEHVVCQCVLLVCSFCGHGVGESGRSLSYSCGHGVMLGCSRAPGDRNRHLDTSQDIKPAAPQASLPQRSLGPEGTIDGEDLEAANEKLLKEQFSVYPKWSPYEALKYIINWFSGVAGW